jgi:hypothetical protein
MRFCFKIISRTRPTLRSHSVFPCPPPMLGVGHSHNSCLLLEATCFSGKDFEIACSRQLSTQSRLSSSLSTRNYQSLRNQANVKPKSYEDIMGRSFCGGEPTRTDDSTTTTTMIFRRVGLRSATVLVCLSISTALLIRGNFSAGLSSLDSSFAVWQQLPAVTETKLPAHAPKTKKTVQVVGLPPNSMDQVASLLLPPVQADDYIRKHLSSEFHFSVYDDLDEKVSWRHLSQCIERRANKKLQNGTVDCDWGSSSVCTEEHAVDHEYSTRRFNRNADVILSKAYFEYEGPLRTRDPAQADAFIVPYPASAHCFCKNDRARCPKISAKDIQRDVFEKLDFLNPNTTTKHVFMSSSQAEINHPFMLKQPLLLTIEQDRRQCKLDKNCGHVTIPYVNTNTGYQPNVVHSHHATPFHKRKYALASAIV